MTPVDQILTAVQRWEHNEKVTATRITRDDAALRATFEEVLADVTMADAETIDAVRTLRHVAADWQRQAESNPQSWRHGYAAGWAAGHEPATCGHARANRKDPMFGTQEYEGNEHCEVCELIADLPCRRCQHWPCNCEQGPLVRAAHGEQP